MKQLLTKFTNRLQGNTTRRKKLVQLYQQELQNFLSTGQQITFTPHPHPVISIIIPVFNKAYHTLRCLKSLAEHNEVASEVIIFDNGSSDETADLLAQVSHIKHIRSAENLGFILANNQAALTATGEYLLLFNNDATLRDGSLNHLIELFETNSNIGAVGARIKFATGNCQEAGSIIFSDGSTDGFLRRGDVNDARGMYCRDVDYCSGVFLSLRREQFLNMGGLDAAYAPAYYEETDLCMRLRQQGSRVVYTPRILIEHFEFGSQPTKLAHHAIAQRKAIFLQRWQETLHRENYFSPKTPAKLASRRLLPSRKLLLIVDDFYSDENNPLIQQALHQGWHVTVYNPFAAMIDWQKSFAYFDSQVELASSKQAASLKALLNDLPDFYTLVLSCGPKAETYLQEHRVKHPHYFKTLSCLSQASPEELLKAQKAYK